jgi:hypothetical protein
MNVNEKLLSCNMFFVQTGEKKANLGTIQPCMSFPETKFLYPSDSTSWGLIKREIFHYSIFIQSRGPTRKHHMTMLEGCLKTISTDMRFQVLTVASMKMRAFWDIALCSLVKVD